MIASSPLSSLFSTLPVLLLIMTLADATSQAACARGFRDNLFLNRHRKIASTEARSRGRCAGRRGSHGGYRSNPSVAGAGFDRLFHLGAFARNDDRNSESPTLGCIHARSALGLRSAGINRRRERQPRYCLGHSFRMLSYRYKLGILHDNHHLKQQNGLVAAKGSFSGRGCRFRISRLFSIAQGKIGTKADSQR